MGCGIACPAMKAAYEENWGLDDPSGKSREEYEKTIRTVSYTHLDVYKRQSMICSTVLSQESPVPQSSQSSMYLKKRGCILQMSQRRCV